MGQCITDSDVISAGEAKVVPAFQNESIGMSYSNPRDRIVGRTVVNDDRTQPQIRALVQRIEAFERVLPTIPIQNDAGYLRLNGSRPHLKRCCGIYL
jgi:hypothetical protein